MYSRNTVGRITQQKFDFAEEKENIFIPPNYGGTMYSNDIRNKTCTNENRTNEEENSEEILPKCICDIAGEDRRFCENVRKKRSSELKENTKNDNGIGNLVDGLKHKSFSAEDILLIAVILIILSENSQNESVILPLLMLLI